MSQRDDGKKFQVGDCVRYKGTVNCCGRVSDGDVNMYGFSLLECLVGDGEPCVLINGLWEREDAFEPCPRHTLLRDVATTTTDRSVLPVPVTSFKQALDDAKQLQVGECVKYKHHVACLGLVTASETKWPDDMRSGPGRTAFLVNGLWCVSEDLERCHVHPRVLIHEVDLSALTQAIDTVYLKTECTCVTLLNGHEHGCGYVKGKP